MYNSNATTIDTKNANVISDNNSHTHISISTKTLCKKTLKLASQIIQTPFRVKKEHVSGCGYVFYLVDVLGVAIGTIRAEKGSCILALNKKQ